MWLWDYLSLLYFWTQPYIPKLIGHPLVRAVRHSGTWLTKVGPLCIIYAFAFSAWKGFFFLPSSAHRLHAWLFKWLLIFWASNDKLKPRGQNGAKSCHKLHLKWSPITPNLNQPKVFIKRAKSMWPHQVSPNGKVWLLYTMRTNLLNWCNFVSISKNIAFYTFLVVRIY
jgi:hypothetical protein